jgi:hypothetical protein
MPPELLDPILAPVKAATWQRAGDTLQATAQTGLDLATLKAHFAEITLREASASNMRAIARALQDYHAIHKRFPPAVVTDADGKPLYSWRVLLLPHLGADDLYRRFHLNRAWDHPSNRPLLNQMPGVFAEPRTKPGAHLTPYQVLTGPGGLFDTPEGRSLADISDGSGRTILFVEAAQPVAWTQPVDVAFSPEVVNRLGVVGPGFHAATADGQVRYIPLRAATPELLRGLFTRAGGEKVTPP